MTGVPGSGQRISRRVPSCGQGQEGDVTYCVTYIGCSSYTESLTDGCWSPTRPSVFFVARQDGYLDSWDVLYQQKAPLLSTKVSDEAVNRIKVQAQGLLLAVGCNDGNTSLMQLSESLSSCHRSSNLLLTCLV